MRRVIVLALLYIYGNVLLCQHTGASGVIPEIHRVAEYFLNNIDSGSAADEDQLQDYLEELSALMSKPLKLNGQNLWQLNKLLVLSVSEIAAIEEHVKRFGAILSFPELIAIPGIEREKLILIKPFISFDGQNYSKTGSYRGSTQFLFRSSAIVQKEAGYMPISREEYLKNINSRYLGSPFLLYGQLRHTGSRVKAIITAEKDPGETGVDYLSGSVQIKELLIAENIVFGSYSASFGQGLVVWNSFSFDAAWQPSDMIKRGGQFSTYGSTDENRAFRGVALAIEHNSFIINLMASDRKIDARVTEDGFTSLLTTGHHNTPVTVERKKSLGSSGAAVNVLYNTSSARVGATLAVHRYSLPYAGRDSLQINRQQKFGRLSANGSVEWRYINGPFLFFGEAAVDILQNRALLGGVVTRLGSRAEMAVSINHGMDKYRSPLSNAILNRGSGNFYGRLSGKIIPSRKLTLFIKGDIANEYHNFAFRGLYLFTEDYIGELRCTFTGTREQFRADIKGKIYGNLNFHTRADLSICRKNGEIRTGYHMHTELLWNKPKINLSARAALFSVPDWENRIYSYEREVLYQFRTFMMYGKGVRLYAVARLKPTHNTDLWLRYSTVRYTDRKTTGEGLRLIQGPSKGEAKIELRVRF